MRRCRIAMLGRICISLGGGRVGIRRLIRLRLSVSVLVSYVIISKFLFLFLEQESNEVKNELTNVRRKKGANFTVKTLIAHSVANPNPLINNQLTTQNNHHALTFVPSPLLTPPSPSLTNPPPKGNLNARQTRENVSERRA